MKRIFSLTDLLQEVFISFTKHRLRTFLTGFGIAWSIFILVVLLGAGEGLRKGIFVVFNDYAQTGMWVFGGQTSISKPGMPDGQRILFNENTIKLLKIRFNKIKAISPESSYYGNSIVRHKENFGNFPVKGVYNSYFKIKTLVADTGKLITPLDEKNIRMVTVIGSHVAEVLFPKTRALGKHININGNYFKVSGILAKGSSFSQHEMDIIYLPFSTHCLCFNPKREFNAFNILFAANIKSVETEYALKKYLARKIGFDINDKKALYIANLKNQVESFNKLFNGINIFLWFIGLCLLITGIIGISNIMLVIVNERTVEIGIRKAVGATPNRIMGLFITESVILTLFSGLVGMLSGIGILQIVNWILERFITDEEFIITETIVNLPMMLFALFIIVLSGCIAGLLPAKKAAAIMPVDAINQENRS